MKRSTTLLAVLFTFAVSFTTQPRGVCLAQSNDKTPESKKILLDFSKSTQGQLPDGWKGFSVAPRSGNMWQVVLDKSTPSKKDLVLAQTAKGTSKIFNLCIFTAGKFQHGEIQVVLRPVSGNIDQGGGILWRYRDPKNYYVCRYNPLEDNLRVYKVVNGQRIQLATAEELPDTKGWRTLRIRHVGDQITCWLDGKALLNCKDNTLPEAGQFGLWTKADAVTHFDLILVTPTPMKP